MKCREKLKEISKAYINDRHLGGCAGCPDHYGMKTAGDTLEYCRKLDCEGCWDREVIEDDDFNIRAMNRNVTL